MATSLLSVLRSRFATLLVGASAAQFIPILVMPVLSRLFAPEDFGILGVYLALVAILSVAGSWRIEHAVLIEADPARAEAIARLCIRLCVFTAAVVLAIVGVLDIAVGDLVHLKLSRLSLYLIPLGLFGNAVIQVYTVRLLRRQSITPLARARVGQAVTTASASIAAGLLSGSGESLILASLAGQTVALAMMVPHAGSPLRANVASLPSVLPQYGRFALFTLPADLLSAASAQLPIFFVASFFGAEAAGAFLMAQRVLLVPLSVVGSAVMDLFKTDASRLFAAQGNCRALTRRTMLALGAVSIPPAIVLILFAPPLFGLVFGAQWHLAGILCQWLAVPAFLRLVTTPISYNFYLAKRQAEDFAAQAYGVASTVLIFGIAHWRGYGASESIAIYAVNLSVLYAYYAFRSLSLSRGVSRIEVA